MISFSIREIILSIIYSFLLGGLLAFFYEFTRVVLFLPDTIFMILKKTKFSDVKIMYEKVQSVFMKILFFFLFTLGSILLSYFVFDGVIRVYVVLLILSGVVLLRKVAFYSLEWVLYGILSIILYPISKIWTKKHS